MPFLQTYVQDLLVREGESISRQILEEGGHVYVCGDCTMAEDVYQTLKGIVQEKGGMNDNEVESYMLSLRVIQTSKCFLFCYLLRFHFLTARILLG